MGFAADVVRWFQLLCLRGEPRKVECAFRAIRPAVPAETGHPFRSKPAGGGEVWCHVYSVVGGDVAGVPGDVLVEE